MSACGASDGSVKTPPPSPASEDPVDAPETAANPQPAAPTVEALGAAPRAALTRLPAWQRPTSGESPWSAVMAALLAVVLQLVLPTRFIPGHRL
jgi:hypothetical protein